MTKREEFESILVETKGELVYSEQLLKILIDVVGFDLETSDKIRKAFGKKKIGECNHYSDILKSRLSEDPELGKEIVSLLEKSAHFTISTAHENVMLRVLDAILKDTEGELRHSYQLFMLLHQVAAFDVDLAQMFVEDLENRQKDKVEELRKFLTQKVYSKKIRDRIMYLVERDLDTMQFGSIHRVAFL